VRAVVAVALMTAALSSLAGTATAEKLEVDLDPTHGLPGVSVTVTVNVPTTESSEEGFEGEPLPKATGNPTCGAYWDDDPAPVAESECDVDRYSGIFWSGSFTVPEDATEGEHYVTVRYGPTEAGSC
jgi:hypothetical protein